jgi:hypothetical protein
MSGLTVADTTLVGLLLVLARCRRNASPRPDDLK